MSAQRLPRLESFAAGPQGAPWVTFVPGIGNDASFWARQAGDLGAAGLRTLRFEPWGCGGSGPPAPGMGAEDVAAGIVALWDSLGIERSAVAGLGFGGSCAMLTALRYPQRVSKLIACCCRPRQPDGRRQFWRDRRAKALAQGLAELTDITVDRWLSPEFRAAHPEAAAALRAAMRRTSVAGYAAYTGAFAEMDFGGELASLTTPALLIAAEHDHGGGPVPAMQALAAQLPAAQLAIVEGSGHLVNWEKPAEVSALLREFLR